MTFNLYLILASMQFFYIMSFAFAMRAMYKKNLPSYMDSFFWYPLVGIVSVALFWLEVFKVIPSNLYINLSKLLLIFHYIFLSNFICRMMGEDDTWQRAKWLFWVSSSIILALITRDLFMKSNLGFSFANLFLFILCILYYYNLFERKPVKLLLNNPAFWIISGVFLGMGITIPAYFFNEYLFASLLKTYYYQLMLSVGIGYAIMHIFFVKALSCVKKIS